MQRNILTVFLASPGDLQEERNITQLSIERVNKILSRKVGWQIDLLGWEDTLPGYSRPQTLINIYADSYDLFIGVLWCRWGQNTGKYSSGFEEEFIRARDRHKKTGKPEIWLFFKKIDEKSVEDPGPQLAKVLKFKEEQIGLKELNYKEFSDSVSWDKLIYDSLLAYVLKLPVSEPQIEIQEQSLVLDSSKGVKETKEAETDKEKVLYPPALINLFDQVNLKLKGEKRVSFDYWDGTRLFLQSSAWFSETHSEKVFGNHEINLVYIQRKNWEISDSERLFLIRSFISDFYDHRPGWFWLRDRNEDDVNNILKSLLTQDLNVSVRMGAINLLADTCYKASRDVIEKGLNDSDENVIVGTIRLIRNIKNSKYIDLLEPFINHNNSQIRESAIETKIELLYLKSPNEGFKYLIETGAKIPALLNTKIENLDLGVDNNLIIKAVESSETSIRRFCAKYLRKAKLLSKDICKELLKNPDALVRKEGLLGLIELDEKIDMDFIRKLFPEPKGSNISALAYALKTAEVRSDDFIPVLFKKYTPEQLLSQIDFYDINGPEAYKILAKKHFQFWKEKIISDLESEFESLKLESENKFKKQYGNFSVEYIQKKLTPETIDSIRGSYISAALEGLLLYGKQEDVKYARKYLGNKKYNVADYVVLKIISRFGDNTDINNLIEIASKSYGETKKIALEAIFNLSENKDSILKKLISHEDETISRIFIQILLEHNSPIEIETAKNLLNSKIDNHRLDGLSILFRYLNETELEKILNDYIKQNTYYYDIITWLDRCLYTVGPYKELFRSKLLSRVKQNN
jgi:HEAT repeat protein